MARKKDTFPLRLRIDDDPRIEKFLTSQSGGYGDVLRYLIEKEIAKNGIRDLSVLIPSKRDIDTIAVAGNINNELPEEKRKKRRSLENMDTAIETEIITIDKSQVDNNINETKDNEIPEGILYKVVADNVVDKERVIDKEEIATEKEIGTEEESEDDIPSCYE